jgi:hypothetical protein
MGEVDPATDTKLGREVANRLRIACVDPAREFSPTCGPRDPEPRERLGPQGDGHRPRSGEPRHDRRRPTTTAPGYVQPYRRDGERVRVSIDGGGQPKWRGDGGEPFFTTLDGELAIAAGVKE